MKQRAFSCVVFSLCVCSLAFGQIDSLKAVLDTAKNDRKVKTLNELFRANLESNPIEALGYTKQALNKFVDTQM